jgi:lipopolysaccharide transport system permease protein
MSSCLQPFQLHWRYREVLWNTTVGELRQRYARSVMGVFWLGISPLLLMAFYAFVYLVVFRVRPTAMSENEYVLYVLAGLLPFLGLSEALASGAASLSSNKAILLNTVFPSELIPVRAVLVSQATTAIGLALTVLVALVMGNLSWTVLLVPLVWLLQVMFVAGIVWALAMATLILRDIQQSLNVATMLLMIVTPIAYTVDMVPPTLRAVVYLNPLSYFVFGFHDVVVFGRAPGVVTLGIMTVLGLSSFCLGFGVFRRAKKMLIDYA